MPESAKECETGLSEGSDIGLGSRDRAFESPHSDQNPLKSIDFRGFSYSLFLAAQILIRIMRLAVDPLYISSLLRG